MMSRLSLAAALGAVLVSLVVAAAAVPAADALAAKSPCSIDKPYNVSVPGWTPVGGFGTTYHVTKDGYCLAIGAADVNFVGVDVATGRVAFNYSFTCYDFCSISTNTMLMVPGEDAFVTVVGDGGGDFMACSSAIKIAFNGTDAWTEWEDELCSSVYGQFSPGGSVAMLQRPGGAGAAVLHLDQSNSGAYPAPSHRASVLDAATGRTVWSGNLTVINETSAGTSLYYGDPVTIDNGNAVVVPVLNAYNGSLLAAYLWKLDAAGVPHVVRPIDANLLYPAPLGVQLNPLVQPAPVGGTFLGTDLYTGDVAWKESAPNPLLANTLYFNSSFWPATQRSMVLNSTTIAVLDYAGDWVSGGNSGSGVATALGFVDVTTGAVTGQTAPSYAYGSCYSDLYTLPGSATLVVLFTAQQYQVLDSANNMRVVSSGTIPQQLPCTNTAAQAMITALDGSYLLYSESDESTILGFPGPRRG